ncbi:MAG TPA: TrkA family potassium uptake protein [Bacillota bacterium]|nr:TrkA family potassium uptake protein [Bacillota bacterium]HPE38728.1 TrkA family potassium uptake protein [Bacillota bacterium]
MKIVMIGAGKVAYYLYRELKASHDVTIIEQDEKTAKVVADRLSTSIINGDGSTYAVLKNECKGADMIIALTGKDETNLIACQIAKKHLGVKFAVARVNNPRNLEVMGKFGVDKPFSGTKILAEMIEQEVDYQGLSVVHTIENSDRVIIVFNLSAESKACNQTLAEYDFVHDSKVVVISTATGETITPRGDTVMHAGERLMMVCSRRSIEQIWKAMVSV